MMAKTTVLFFALLLMVINVSGQGVVIIDSTTTPSICFNDGTIHVAASGGTGPYSFAIISGPSYPNITYPISLAPLASTFLTIPRGTYTIRVTDASGGTAFATATVGGSYQFPVLTPTITSDYCIQVSLIGGKAPFHYSISSTSSNSGFGQYQSSNLFCICTGHYWVRVLDSCSNIFTTARIDVNIPQPQIQLRAQTAGALDSIFTDFNTSGAPPYTYHLKSGNLSITNTTGIFSIPKSCGQDTITLTDRCGQTAKSIINPHPLIVNGVSNCNLGDAALSISPTALGPYTITGSGGSQTTHSNNVTFNGLPLHSAYNFTITDSCGNQQSLTLSCSVDDTLFFEVVCPFDSSLHFRHNQINYCYPVVLTCLSCTPVQKDTVYSTPMRVFANIDTGVAYTIRIQDACGFDYTTQYTPHYTSLAIFDSIFTCSDFAMMSDPRVFIPPIHYDVYSGTTIVASATANEPIFYHIPTGGYQIIASHDLCKNGRIFVNLPALSGSCIVPMFDSSCTPSCAVFQPYMASPETFTLVNTATGASYSEHLPRPSGTPILFSNVPVGNYNLVSDSGCATPYILPPFSHQVTATYNVECTGQSKITAVAVPPIVSCNTAQGQYFTLLKDNQYLQSNNTGVFIVSDTGYFVIRLFLSNTSIFHLPSTYDTICPLDTVLLYVRVSPIPNIVSIQQEVCGHHTANIPYTILGGTAPYTVQIIGYPTRTVTTVNDTFPNVYPGVYTMIVSDNCGISRSFSVAVIDTCSSTCVTQSHFLLSDSIICRNMRTSLHNQSIGSTHYKWVINGTTFAYANDTSFTTNTPGTYTITLYAYIGTCVDSSKHKVIMEDTLRAAGVKDTFLCAPSSIRLNTHHANSMWSDNTSDSIINISGPGVYWAQITNTCGSVRDSFNISQRLSPLFDLMSPKGYICSDQPDSTILTAILIDTTGAHATFAWSSGHIDSSVYSSQIIVYHSGSYAVTVTDGFCPLTADTSIVASSCDSICYAHIAIPDAFSPNGDNKNDTFYLLHFCKFDPFTMHIYNRWGEQVFTSSDIDQGWDGRYKGMPQADGVYWFWVSLSIENKKARYLSGKVTLLR